MRPGSNPKLDSNAARAPAVASVRLDQWLWAARFFKTRALARKAIENGRVSLNAHAGKPASAVHVRDALTIVRGEERMDVLVSCLSSQRGSATVAQTLYQETDLSRVAREQAREVRRLQANGYQPPESKPDKRARRLIRALGDIDAL